MWNDLDDLVILGLLCFTLCCLVAGWVSLYLAYLEQIRYQLW